MARGDVVQKQESDEHGLLSDSVLRVLEAGKKCIVIVVIALSQHVSTLFLELRHDSEMLFLL